MSSKSLRAKGSKKGSAKPKADRHPISNVVGLAVVALVFAALAYGVVSGRIQTRSRNGQSQAKTPDRTGQPWEYDEATNSHWDPRHGHWHQGPPPEPSQRTSTGSSNGTVPDRVGEPWEHDEATNTYWDPGHGHWHTGQPPPPEQRGTTTP